MSEHYMEPAAIVGEAVAGQSAQRAAAVKIELEHLNTLVQDSTFDIAELLSEVKENHYYGAWGFETFEEYVEIVLGMKKVKAYYLIRIVNTAKKLEIPRSEYEDVNISKLREIFTLNPFDKEGNELHSPITGEKISDHIKELVTKARVDNTPLKDVVDAVSKIKGEVGEQEMVFIPALKVTKLCRDNVILPARELARKKLGSMSSDGEGDVQEYSDSAVEECIHADFLADPNNADQPATEDYVSQQVQDQDFPEDFPYTGTQENADKLDKEFGEDRVPDAPFPNGYDVMPPEKVPFEQAHEQFLEEHESFLKEARPKGTKI
jgi:hypothetical protein